MLQRAPRDPLGSARGALGELLGRSGDVLGCFGSPFGSILGEQIELGSGIVAFFENRAPVYTGASILRSEEVENGFEIRPWASK